LQQVSRVFAAMKTYWGCTSLRVGEHGLDSKQKLRNEAIGPPATNQSRRCATICKRWASGEAGHRPQPCPPPALLDRNCETNPKSRATCWKHHAHPSRPSAHNSKAGIWV